MAERTWHRPSPAVPALCGLVPFSLFSPIQLRATEAQALLGRTTSSARTADWHLSSSHPHPEACARAKGEPRGLGPAWLGGNMSPRAFSLSQASRPGRCLVLWRQVIEAQHP